MNLKQQQSTATGAFLIGLALVWLFNLWSLLLPGVLAVVGVVVYQKWRRLGRTREAVQVGLWGVGLALVLLLGFIWPGVLFLAGASVLLRGREDQFDAAVQRRIAEFPQLGAAVRRLIAQLRQRRSTARSVTTQQVPISSQPSQPAQIAPHPRSAETPVVGETTRLNG
jgi:hypothetical protein